MEDLFIDVVAVVLALALVGAKVWDWACEFQEWRRRRKL